MPTLHFLEFPDITSFREAARNGFGRPELVKVYRKNLADHCENFLPGAVSTVNQGIREANLGDELVSNLTYDQVLNGQLVRFAAPALLDKLEQEFEQEIIKLGLMNKLPKPELTFNDRGMGTFVFDRAAQTLQYRYEYFSPVLDRVVEDSEFALADGDPDEEPRFTLLSDGSEVIRRVLQQENGLPAVTTKNKKVFAYVPRHTKLSGGVELYLTAGNYHFTGDGYLYSGIVAMIIIKLLERAGIKVKLNLVVGWVTTYGTDFKPSHIRNLSGDETLDKANYERFKREISSSSNAYCAAIITAKNYNESLDRNLLALISSDPRFWKAEGYATCQTIGSYFGRPTSYGLVGRALKALFEVTDYKPEMKFKFCYGRVQSEAEVIGEIKRAINELAEFSGIHGNNVVQTDPSAVVATS